MNFLSVLYAKAGITVDGITTLNNTATALTPTTSDNSTKIATTAFVKNQNYYPYPTGTTAQYVRGDGSLATFPTVASEAQTLVTEVYNETGATLTKGTVVYINGGHGNLPTITKALASSDATSAQTYGVVQNDITDNNNGYVVVIGSVIDLNTNSYLPGTILYLSPTTAGEWTSTKPYAPQHIVYVAIVVRQHPTQGVVEVRVQNGYEMDELHNVSAQSPANGDILQFNFSTQLWTKTAGTTTNIAEGTNLYFTDARARAAITLTTTGTSGAATYSGGVLNIPQYQAALTNPVTGTGTTNYITKWTSGSAVGNSIIYDNGTNVGIGTTSPGKRLDVVGTTETSIRVRDTGGASLEFYQQALNSYILATNNLIFYTAGASRLTISTTGAATFSSSVTATNGIFNGVSSTNLKVQNGANANTLFLIQSFGTEASGENASILFKSAANSTDSSYAKGLVAFVNNGTGYGRGSLIFATNNNTDSANATASDAKLTIAANGAATFSSSVTASSLIKSGGTSSQFLMADGSTSTLTNPITGTGTTNYLPKFTGTSALGNSLVYDNGTNVGIGTTSPSTKLHILSYNSSSTLSTSNTASLVIQNTYGSAGQTGGALFFKSDTGTNNTFAGIGGDLLGSTSSGSYGHLIFGTKNTATDTSLSERMRITSDGNVGIGTTAPTAKLDIRDSNKVFDGYGNVNIFTSDSFAENIGGSIAFGGASNGGTTPYPFAKIQGYKEGSGSWSGSLIFGTTQSNSALTEKMRITSAGNVGIGTTNPITPLTVNGSIAITTGGGYLSNIYYSGGWKYIGNGYAWATFIDGTAGDYVFYSAGNNTSGANASASPTERIRFTNTGNLLIGTTTDAGYKLDVNGTARVTSSLTINSSVQSQVIGSDGTYGSTYPMYSFTGISNGYHRIFAGTVDDMYFAAATSRGFKFRPNGGTTNTFIIAPNGNVLIGTTTDAGYKLDINGTARIQGALTVSAGILSNRAAAGNANGISFQTAGISNWYVGSAAVGSNTDLQFYNHSASAVVLNIANTTGAATFVSNITTAQNISATSLVIKARNDASGSFAYSSLEAQSSSGYGAFVAWGLGSVRADSVWLQTNGSYPLVFGINDSEVARFQTNGYLYMQNWISFPNYTGLVSDNNSAHFYPNPGSYGSWKVLGTRNGWAGLEFGSTTNGAISLMIGTDSALVGFHNNGGYGWVFYWQSGTFYVSKGTYGGSQVAVLDASNVGSYAVKLYGTITGNIDSDYGECFVTFDPIPSGTPPLSSPNIRTINVGNSYSRRTQLAFDYASDTAFFRRRTEAGWFTWREFIHSGNVGSYALPISGGTLTGNLILPNSYDLSWGGTYGASKPTISASDGVGIRFYPDGASSGATLTIASSGNVQIGTTTDAGYKLDVNGATRATDFYTDGWFRNSSANKGLYNSSYNTHLYSRSGGIWSIASSNSSLGYLEFWYRYYDEPAAEIKGSIVWNSEGFGLLNNQQSDFSVLCNQGTSYGGTLRGDWNITGANLSINSEGTFTYSNITYSSSLDPGPYNWYSGVAYDGVADETYYYIYYSDGNQFRLYVDGTIYINGGAFSQYTATSNYISVGAYGLYSSTYSAYFRRNDASSYAPWELVGAKGGYTGMYYSASNQPHIMFNTSNGYGGLYYQTGSRWVLYYDYGNNCLGVGQATTSASYKLYVTGAIYATGAIVANSDGRNKENVEVVENALDKVNSLRGVTYTKKDQDSGKREMGVIAQEVLPHVPEVIQYAEDLDQYGVSYGNFAGLFIEAIKEQQVLINELKAEIEILKNK